MAWPTANSDPLIASATAFAKSHMARYDGSHSFTHIERVVRLARTIYEASATSSPSLDAQVIHLAALLHDVGDRKYVLEGEGDPKTAAERALVSFGASAELARTVQEVCDGISYSSEVADPARAASLLAAHPEVGIVQDSDRLDAIGAVGIGRMFAYGGAKTTRGLEQTMEHLDEKLVKLESMMKTEKGKQLAKERTERLLTFKSWWIDEAVPSTQE
jgi:uncharacterized protein